MSLTFRRGSGKLCPAPRYGVARKRKRISAHFSRARQFSKYDFPRRREQQKCSSLALTTCQAGRRRG